MASNDYAVDSVKALTTIARGGGIFLAGFILSKIISYAFRLVVSRLGAEDYGIFSLGFMVFDVFTMVTLFGVLNGILRFVPEYEALNDWKRLQGTFVNAVKIVSVSGVAGSALLFLYSDFIALTFFHELRLSPVLKIIALGIPFYNLASVASATMRALNKFEYEVAVKLVIENLLKLLFALAAVSLGVGLIGAAAGFSLAYVASMLVAFALLDMKVKPLVSSWITGVRSESSVKRLLSFSLPTMVAGILWLFVSWSDVVSLGYFRGIREVGVYNTALPTAALIAIIPVALESMFRPIIASMLAVKKREAINRVYFSLTKWILVLNLPVLLLAIIFSHQIIALLFGHEYASAKAGTVLAILALGFFLNYALRVGDDVITSFDRTTFFFFNAVATALVSVTLNILFVPSHGPAGAAVATALALSFYGLNSFFKSVNLLGRVPFSASHAKIVAAALFSSSAAYALVKLGLLHSDAVNLLAFSLVFGILYTMLLKLLHVADDYDVQVASAVARKLGLKINLRKLFG